MTPSVVKNVLRMPRKRAAQVRQRISYLNDDQLQRLLRVAKEYGPREYSMFLTGLAHGLRASEICNLRISDVNLKNEQIHIARLKGSLDSTQTLLRVKGNPLFGEAAALESWLSVRKPDGDTYLYNSQKSTKLNRVTVFRLFRDIARKAELPENLRHPHCLKHSLAMLLVRSGANAFLIRQMLGHKSFDSTLAYTHPSDADASAAAIQAFNKTF